MLIEIEKTYENLGTDGEQLVTVVVRSCCEGMSAFARGGGLELMDHDDPADVDARPLVLRSTAVAIAGAAAVACPWCATLFGGLELRELDAGAAV